MFPSRRSFLNRSFAITPCKFSDSGEREASYALLILERSHFKEWQQHDNRAVSLTAEQVRDYNRLQVMKSSAKVYCANDDFEPAQRFAGRILKSAP